MKKWTIGRGVNAAIGLSALVTLILGICNWSKVEQIYQSATGVSTGSLPEQVAAGDIRLEVFEVRVSNFRGVAATNGIQKAELEQQVEGQQKKLLELVSQFESYMNTDEERLLFSKAKPLMEAFLAQSKSLWLAIDQNNMAEAQRLLESADGSAEEFIKADNAMRQHAAEKAAAGVNYIVQSVLASKRMIVIAMIVAVLLGAGVGIVVTRTLGAVLLNVAKELSTSSVETTSAAEQVSASSQSLAEGASEQAASLQETGASLEEMSSMTKRNAESAQKVNELARQARTAADKGAIDMQAMNNAMEEIKTASDDVAKIIKAIDEIAFQTNILALNAAVEAARAGEAGMGFAVVAEEVRNLAQRSAQAAKETAAKIEGSIDKTAQGVEISSKVGGTLNEIVAKARQVDELAAEVATASREQTQGIAQINIAVAQMDKVTQSNAARAEESAAAAQELNAQALSMKQSVEQLMVLAGGSYKKSPESKPENVGERKKGSSPALSKNNRGKQGNGRSLIVAAGTRNGDIPMEGDFKDF